MAYERDKLDEPMIRCDGMAAGLFDDVDEGCVFFLLLVVGFVVVLDVDVVVLDVDVVERVEAVVVCVEAVVVRVLVTALPEVPVAEESVAED